MLLTHLDLLATAPNGVARLRELILTLAVQGKLVPQDPADEPASVLLQKIRAEKDRLMAEGKIKRGKSLAEISEEEKPFELPAGWEWVRLGTLTNISTGKLDANAAVTDGQYPFFTCSNTPLSIDRFSFDCSAILLAGNGDFNLKHYRGKFDAYQRTYVIEPILLDLQFLYFTLSKYIGELTKNQRGSAIPYLKLGDITNPLIPIPPVLEQSRIVTRVEELMELCDALEAKGKLEAAQHARLVSTLLATLTDSTTPEELAENWQRVSAHFDLLLDRPEAVDALEQTILQLAVRGLLVPQDPQDEPASALLARIRAEKDRLIAEGKIKRGKPLAAIEEEEKPFGLPLGWEWVRMGYLIELISGQHLGPSEYVEGLGASIPYLTGPAEFGVVSPEPTRSTKERRAVAVQADILITVKGSGVGKLNVVKHAEIAISRQLMAIRPVITDSEFLKVVLQTMALHFQEMSVGIAIPGIGREDVTHTQIGLPPLPEQSRIVARVASLRQLCADLRQRLKAAQSTQVQLAQALIEEVA